MEINPYRVSISRVEKVSSSLDKLVENLESFSLAAIPGVGSRVGESHRAQTKPADLQPGATKKRIFHVERWEFSLQTVGGQLAAGVFSLCIL